jgi:hypothetical protein
VSVKAVGDDRVRASRGIDVDVWEGRPYTPWTTDDRSAIQEKYDGLSGAQRSFMMMLAGQRDGWIINRHAVPGAEHVWPEIRSEGLVRTGPPRQHWHGPGKIPEGLERKYSVLDRDSEAWENHCARVDAADDEQEPKELKPHAEYEAPHSHESLAKCSGTELR